MNDSERARLDYEWHNMNAVERTEVLKRRLDRMERPVYVVRAGEINSEELDIKPGQFASVSGFSPGSEGPRHEYVECAELARLRRIEEAARAVCRWRSDWDRGGADSGLLKFVELRAALYSEPKR